jgi:hypothetical protein
VALYKLKLENEGEPARLAKYILKASTMSHAGNSSNYFVDRISFQAVADKLIEEHDSKRARRDFGGDGGSSNPMESQQDGASASTIRPW